MQALHNRMQDGKVQLPSGTWDWKARPQQSGATVTFQHRNRQRDEMRTWSPDLDLSQEKVHQLALEPVERLWLDPDGLLWCIRVGLPSDWARRDDQKERILHLVFSCGSLQKVIAVPADTKLGELSHFDLAKMLNAS